MGVGKTNVVQRLLGGTAPTGPTPPGPTIGVDFASRSVQLAGDSRPLRLNLWDTSGDPRFRELADGCMQDLRDHDAVIIVYDLTQRGTFEAVETWVETVRQATRNSDPILVLLGNKA